MSWTHPLKSSHRVDGPRCEVTPFVFNDRLYRLENFVRSHDFPGKEHSYRFRENGFRIVDVAEDRIISIPLLNNYFAVAFPWENRCYVFTGAFDSGSKPWQLHKTLMMYSDDLISWSKPQVVLESNPDERLFNYAICRARGKFYMLYETNDPRWPAFTMRFCESDDLIKWRKLDCEHIYGTDKYTGGPALYFDHEEDIFYLLYVNSVHTNFDTRIARSKDLITWEDASPDRIVLDVDTKRDVDAERFPGAKECSASDIELCEFQGKTHIYWICGNQQGAATEYCEVYNGSMVSFLRAFFE